MALVRCPDCDAEVSTTANRCPKCGGRIPIHVRYPLTPKDALKMVLLLTPIMAATIWFLLWFISTL